MPGFTDQEKIYPDNFFFNILKLGLCHWFWSHMFGIHDILPCFFRGYIIMPVCQIRTQIPYLNIMTLLKLDLIQRDDLLDRVVLNM